MSDYVPKVDGLSPYIISTHGWGRVTYAVKYAANLAEAKSKYGYTRNRYDTIKVRRARNEDRALVKYGWRDDA